MEEIFSCKRCGACCQGETTVSLSPADQQRMLDHLQISRREAFARFWRQSRGVVQMKTVNGHCVFYENGCSVHAGRPYRCREWPLIQAILCDASTLDTLRASCPGLSKTVAREEVCRRLREDSSSRAR